MYNTNFTKMITEQQKQKQNQVKKDLRKTELAIILHNNCTVEQLEAVKEIIEAGVNFKKVKASSKAMRILIEFSQNKKSK